MPTLVSRKYFTLGAPPAVVDVDYGMTDVVMTWNIEEIGMRLTTGLVINTGPTRLTGQYFKQGKYFVVTQTIRPSVFQQIGAMTPAGIRAREGTTEVWADELWPDVTWLEFISLVGDFYHQIIP